MIEVLSNAALATVQDQGREGYLRYGVGTSGAMDRVALSVGNLLLGNDDDAAGIEIPMFPFQRALHGRRRVRVDRCGLRGAPERPAGAAVVDADGAQG